jgi:hypothetical protein
MKDKFKQRYTGGVENLTGSRRLVRLIAAEGRGRGRRWQQEQQLAVPRPAKDVGEGNHRCVDLVVQGESDGIDLLQGLVQEVRWRLAWMGND